MNGHMILRKKWISDHMRKKIEIIMVVVLLLAAVFVGPRSASYVMNMRAKTAKVRIVVDPGHGGGDPGKVGTMGTEEKEINLQVSKKLQACLQEAGMEVVLTRETDESLAEEGASSEKVSDLKKRVELIEKEDPVLTVSIHQNSYPDSSVNGAQVFYYGQSEEGRLLAEAIQQSLIECVDPSNHREAKANESYFMLKKTPVTTVIVECGFLSNPEEEALLQEEEYQEKMAEAITAGIQNYLNSGEKNPEENDSLSQ